MHLFLMQVLPPQTTVNHNHQKATDHLFLNKWCQKVAQVLPPGVEKEVVVLVLSANVEKKEGVVSKKGGGA